MLTYVVYNILCVYIIYVCIYIYILYPCMRAQVRLVHSLYFILFFDFFLFFLGEAGPLAAALAPSSRSLRCVGRGGCHVMCAGGSDTGQHHFVLYFTLILFFVFFPCR
jgi:hypothetical protein